MSSIPKTFAVQTLVALFNSSDDTEIKKETWNLIAKVQGEKGNYISDKLNKKILNLLGKIEREPSIKE